MSFVKLCKILGLGLGLFAGGLLYAAEEYVEEYMEGDMYTSNGVQDSEASMNASTRSNVSTKNMRAREASRQAVREENRRAAVRNQKQQDSYKHSHKSYGKKCRHMHGYCHKSDCYNHGCSYLKKCKFGWGGACGKSSYHHYGCKNKHACNKSSYRHYGCKNKHVCNQSGYSNAHAYSY